MAVWIRETSAVLNRLVARLASEQDPQMPRLLACAKSLPRMHSGLSRVSTQHLLLDTADLRWMH